jgi:hypothetical protein
MTLEEVLKAMKQQHDAIDHLLALLIMWDKEFMPTKSVAWPAMIEGNRIIKLLELGEKLK